MEQVISLVDEFRREHDIIRLADAPRTLFMAARWLSMGATLPSSSRLLTSNSSWKASRFFLPSLLYGPTSSSSPNLAAKVTWPASSRPVFGKRMTPYYPREHACPRRLERLAYFGDC